MTISARSIFQAHPFHLVSPSPWPAFTSGSLFVTVFGWYLLMYGFFYGFVYSWSTIGAICCTLSLWFRDVISEGTYLGNHTAAVQKGLSMGMALFITSEALFFLGIFWAFFHSALSPTIEMGSFWPPEGVLPIDSLELPLLNTVLLLSSGVTVTFSHHALLKSFRGYVLKGFFVTVLLAAVFTDLQAEEYTTAPFTISDGTYGSCFYMSTGFHGFHVLIGTIFLVVCLWRVLSYQVTSQHHVGVESGISYWHFVDVVWIFLLASVYYWGS